MERMFVGLLFLITFIPCLIGQSPLPWKIHGQLQVIPESRVIHHEDGTPFLWLGCTAWGMTEWMTREDVDHYLDDRQSKGFNVVQFCLLWGKRQDHPVRFTVNAANPHGHRPLAIVNEKPDPTSPAQSAGGSPDHPNDYWDHVHYCLQAMQERGMYAAVLPVWGRRYVNATHADHGYPLFDPEQLHNYGKFVGKSFGHYPNIIWVNGGDVKATDGGDYLEHYRKLAKGIKAGMSDQPALQHLITYHPDGAPMVNSSEWFHDDAWLDFHMIETHISRDRVTAAVRHDLALPKAKPTVMAEGHYEGYGKGDTITALHTRRQAYQTFFAGAAGFTYGGFFGADGNGPLFSGSNNWRPLLKMKGASQMVHLLKILEDHQWDRWREDFKFIRSQRGVGEVEKIAISIDNKKLVYFPDNSAVQLDLEHEVKRAVWINPTNGKKTLAKIKADGRYRPPKGFSDAILVLQAQ